MVMRCFAKNEGHAVTQSSRNPYPYIHIFTAELQLSHLLSLQACSPLKLAKCSSDGRKVVTASKSHLFWHNWLPLAVKKIR